MSIDEIIIREHNFQTDNNTKVNIKLMQKDKTQYTITTMQTPEIEQLIYSKHAENPTDKYEELKIRYGAKEENFKEKEDRKQYTQLRFYHL